MHRSHPLARLPAWLLAAALLGGCAGQGGLPHGGGSEVSLADGFTRLVDERCALPADKQLDTRHARELRLLRGEWLLALLTRYGAARIADSSGDKAADAAMLLARVNQVAEVVRRAQAEVGRDPNQFEVYRADLIIALLNTAASAIEPSLKSVAGFVVKPQPQAGLELLKGYFKDRLYADAYEKTCADYMAAAADRARLEAVRHQVETHLLEQCDRLAAVAGLAHRCQITPGVPLPPAGGMR